MLAAFDKCPTRPPHIDAILNGLDRYNPETTTVFQDYVSNQCEEKIFDAYACLALLKLYVEPLILVAHAKLQHDEQDVIPRFLLPESLFEGNGDRY